MNRRQVERKEGNNKVKSRSPWGGRRVKVDEIENEEEKKKTAEKIKKTEN